MKIAVVNCCDTGPIESLHLMLKHVGYEVQCLSVGLIDYLRRVLNCDSVNSLEWAQHFEGVEPPIEMKRAEISALNTCDLYVDVKAHRNGPKIWEKHPRLKDRTIWYRINGGKPENCGRGEEISPPCPILTPNLWYKDEIIDFRELGSQWSNPYELSDPGEAHIDCDFPYIDTPWKGRAYTMWPPFMRFNEYPPRKSSYTNPICLVHNLAGWGYGNWAKGARELGVKIHGTKSPDGLIKHSTLKDTLSRSLAMVHLKQSDAPGYALYEAMAAGCPLIVSERLVKNNRMHEMFIDEETCLYFDRLTAPDLTHSNLTPDDPRIVEAVAEIGRQLDRLKNPEFNSRIGSAGRNRLQSLMWNPERDGEGLQKWFNQNFPQ